MPITKKGAQVSKRSTCNAERDITRVFGVAFDNVTLSEAVERTRVLVETSGKTCTLVVAPNTEIVMQAQRDHAFFDILNSAALSTPDSVGIMMAGKRQGKPFKDRIPGQSYYRAVCSMAQQEGYTLYLLGGRGDTAMRAKAVAEREFPGLSIVGASDGYFDQLCEEETIGRINALQPNILFVCMGAPVQETWITAHAGELKVDVAVGEGGLFDYESGNVKRAPLWMQKVGIEWLWRLILQPSRITRMAVLPVFFLKTVFSKDVSRGKWDVQEQ